MHTFMMLMKRLLKVCYSLSIIGLITFVLLEVVLIAWGHFGTLKMELPTYTFENTQSFWFDLNKYYGTSHLPNHHYRQKKACYDITYSSNLHGFRDRERMVEATENRVLVLGDSFMEGVGVDTSKRVSNMLERETNMEHLNFGMAGNFGSTQYMLLYQSFAKKFSHNAIILSILPANDFIDDDYEIGHRGLSNRYRPYLQGTYPDYTIVYFQDSLYKSSVHTSKLKPLKKLFKNFTYSYNAFLYFKASILQSFNPKQKELTYEELPGYFNYTPQQLNRLKFALQTIRKESVNRPMLAFTIPSNEDILAYKKIHQNPLKKELELFCKQYNIQYIDLLSYTEDLTEEECNALYLECDGHWSEKGNAWAANIIKTKFEHY